MNYPKFKLLIKTNHYTGNFNREFMAFVFGFYPEHGNTERYNKNFCQKYGEDDVFPLCYFYDQYGVTACEIENTNNLIVYFEDKLNNKHKKIIKERLENFPGEYAKDQFAPKDLKIVSLEYYKIEVEEKRWYYD